MSLMDILQQYSTQAGARDQNVASQHFDEVARSAPPDALRGGVAEAFRSNQTPPFGQMVAQLFGQSNPQQRAGVLNQLLGSVGPGMLAGLGGGMLGKLLGQGNTGNVQVTPDQAAQVTPEQVEQVATHVEKHDPTVVDKIGGFYSEHPGLVKTLGSAALSIALASIAGRMRS